MTNYEWLLNMGGEERQAWFDAQHVDGVEIQGEPDELTDSFMEHVDYHDGEWTVDGAYFEDSSEKLEADWTEFYTTHERECLYQSDVGQFVFDLLDRQAAITANETSHDNPYVGLVRGKQWERTEISDYYCGRCGWKVTDHDSYCPECGGALHKASNKPNSQFGALKTAETGENATSKNEIHNFDDSREQLEADVLDYQGAWPLTDSTPIDVTWGIVRGWLDRQEAITEREVGGTLLRQDERIAELIAQANELSQQLINERADCNEYRELFSKALTHAHEIANLQP